MDVGCEKGEQWSDSVVTQLSNWKNGAVVEGGGKTVKNQSGREKSGVGFGK